MKNLIKSLVNDLSKEIAKKRVKDSQMDSPKADESKVKLESQKKKLTKAKEEFDKKTEESINEAIKDGSRYLEETKSDLNDYGTTLGILSVGTVQFSSRLAMIPPAIISATPMGPGISANLIPPMTQDLKAEGDILSKHYDDLASKRSKLQLDSLSQFIPGLGSVLSITDSIMSTSKPLITLVGASCGDIEGSIPDIKPPFEITYKAEDCSSFTPINGNIDPDGNLVGGVYSASNCSRFSSMNGDKVDCTNCKNFRG